MYKSCMHTQSDGKTKKAGLIETREGMGRRLPDRKSKFGYYAEGQISDALENTLVKHPGVQETRIKSVWLQVGCL